MGHIPVLLSEVLEVLSPLEGESVLDGTLGLGGHAKTFLEKVGPSGHLVGVDADAANLRTARERLSRYANVSFIHANFRDLPSCLPEDRRSFDVLFADLGLSSPHLDDPQRGFSMRGSAPLDMRYDPSTGMTAAMKLASTDARTMERWFREYGELPKARVLAEAIVDARSEAPIALSGDLTVISERVYGWKAKEFLPQVFQALRIAVNEELSALEQFLRTAPELLRPGGRLGIISYHSLEDRLVKAAFRSLTSAERDPVTGTETGQPTFRLLTKRAVRPGEEEVQRNPRSRSAKFRALRKQEVYTSRRSR